MLKNHRRCVSCRKVAPKSELWRVVRLAEGGTIVLDQGMGRSAYLCPCEDCLKAAQKKDRISRSLKAPVDPNIYNQLNQRLENKVVAQPRSEAIVGKADIVLG
jgi:uncharacterized protein